MTGKNGPNRAKRPRIWDGIYNSFPSLPPSAAFSGFRWIESQLAEARTLMSNPAAPSSGGTLLSEALSGWCAARPGPVSILDFGGGFALDYLRLQGRGLPVNEINYCVMETAEVCRAGRKLFKKNAKVSFRSTFPSLPATIDVFHAASSLQYVKDWRGFLGRVSALHPRLLVLGGMLAGNIPTFASIQNYYGIHMPVWFLNKGELLTHLESLGYECVFEGIAEARYFGRVRQLPMMHFPSTHRLPKKCNLILRRKSTEIQ